MATKQIEKRKRTGTARVATAFRKAAARLEREWQTGRRSWAIDAGDLIEVMRAVADELEPVRRAKR